MEKENEKDKLKKLPDCAIEFIAKVIRKMRYSKGVSDDVQAELTTHFKDELKDCKTDQERLEKAGRLIAEFGDVRMLAILMRRAKKRCRPLWRTMIVRTFQTAGVLILLMVTYIGWFLSGKPAITTNYVAQLNVLVRPQADESLNAEPYYQKAIASMGKLSDEFIVFFSQNYHDEDNTSFIEDLKKDINKLFSNKESPDFKEKRNDIQEDVLRVLSMLHDRKYYDFIDDQKNVVRGLIQEENEALNFAVEGSRKPYYWPVYTTNSKDPGDVAGIFLPNLSNIRKLSGLLIWRAWIKSDKGLYEDALDDIKASYRIGRHFKGDKTVIEQLVGIAIEGLSTRAMRGITGQYVIGSQILKNFQQNFERIIAEENFTISCKAEKLCVLDEIQRCFTSGSIGKGHLYLPRLNSLGIVSSSNDNVEYFLFDILNSPGFLFKQPNKEETLKTTDEIFDYYNQISLKTAAQVHKDVNDISKTFYEMTNGNYFLNHLSPSFGSVFQISSRIRTEVGASLTVIALVRYKEVKGIYPKNLDELVTDGYLKKMPIDYFSDKPLVYRQSGESFILYSYGLNFKDDGGKESRDRKGKVQLWSDEADAVFWPLSELKQ